MKQDISNLDEQPVQGRANRGRRFIIVGFGLSEPGTMGGNTKIALELARHLVSDREVHVVVPSSKVKTVTDAIGVPAGLTIHAVERFAGGDLRHPFSSAAHYTECLRRVLSELKAGPDDTVYSASDFHVDTVPCWRLKPAFGYRWIATQFLFVPFVVENLLNGYKFPALKYLLVWAYSYHYFRKARSRADAFVITNDTDRRHFPKAFQRNVFAMYGGVNVDQIPHDERAKTRDVVFCSRLHPQKGIDGFLDIWKRILDGGVRARLTVIGNGAPDYEAHLKAKAVRLGIADSIDWLGYVNNAAKYEVYRSAKVMVHPTVFDNNGMVAAEALCSGLPVVMYDLPALRDIYTTGCVKVPFGDQARFAAEVSRLLADPTVAAPKPQEIAALREKWDWSNRVAAFKSSLLPLMP